MKKVLVYSRLCSFLYDLVGFLTAQREVKSDTYSLCDCPFPIYVTFRNTLDWLISEYYFRHLENLYLLISSVQSQEITKLTNCQKPCFYRKYAFVGDAGLTAFPSKDFIFSFTAVSNDSFIETEILVYPWTSLVAEFGGTLSLFLGYSFMTLWDGVYYFVKWIAAFKQ